MSDDNEDVHARGDNLHDRDDGSDKDQARLDGGDEYPLKPRPTNQRRRTTTLGEREHECKLLTPVPDSEDTGNNQGFDFGDYRRGSEYDDARSKSRSSYRQPTVLTVSSEYESDDGVSDDAAQDGYEGRGHYHNEQIGMGKGKAREVSPFSSQNQKYQEMKEVEDNDGGSGSWLKRDLLREIAAMHHPMIRAFLNEDAHGNSRGRSKKYIWDEHRGGD